MALSLLRIKTYTAENKENSIPAKAPEYTLLAQKNLTEFPRYVILQVKKATDN